MVRRRRRRCRYCQDLFVPDPRVKKQKSCGKPPCSRQRKLDADENWRGRRRNRDYFRGRYNYLKTWLALPENIGYLRGYRRRHRRAAT